MVIDLPVKCILKTERELVFEHTFGIFDYTVTHFPPVEAH